jgi:hypothetical protein
MRVKLLRFGGYPAGTTDFATVGALVPGGPLSELGDALDTIGKGIAGVESIRATITVVGHADRQDRADLDCAARRDSEIAAARDRATSAWEWAKLAISESAEQNGWTGGDWWENSDRATWDLVFAATGMLLNGSANEAERAQNRRVDFLISIFPI